MSEQKFVNGMWVKYPKNAAPSYILMDVSFNVDDMIDFLQRHKNEQGYVNVTIKKSKNGKPYAQLNEWKPSNNDADVPIAEMPEDDLPDDLPF